MRNETELPYHSDLVIVDLIFHVSLETDIIFNSLESTHWKKNLNVNNAKIDNLYWLRTIFRTDVSPKNTD